MQIWHWSPRPGAKTDSEPRIITANFGDGYSQRAPKGINPQLDKHSVSFRDTTAEVMRMVAFLKSHGGYKAFLFVPHGKFTDELVICKKWDVAHHARWSELNATFEEVPA